MTNPRDLNQEPIEQPEQNIELAATTSIILSELSETYNKLKSLHQEIPFDEKFEFHFTQVEIVAEYLNSAISRLFVLEERFKNLNDQSLITPKSEQNNELSD